LHLVCYLHNYITMHGFMNVTFGVLMVFYGSCLVDPILINFVDCRRFSVFRVDRWIQEPGHLCDILPTSTYALMSQHSFKCQYEGVSKSFETSSIDRQPMALRECVRCALEQEASPLSMPSGVAVWTLGVTQHEYLPPRVPSHLRFQHGRETGADSKHQILRETRQIWSGYFWNNMTCV
jgi:hypothetical protein